MSFWNKERISPSQIIILGYFLLIVCGTGLLMLPFTTKDGAGPGFGDALFTATSAITVTGLVVHDTVRYWSLFGQIIILLLIQVGGLGVMSMAVAVAVLVDCAAVAGDAMANITARMRRMRRKTKLLPEGWQKNERKSDEREERTIRDRVPRRGA